MSGRMGFMRKALSTAFVLASVTALAATPAWADHGHGGGGHWAGHGGGHWGGGHWGGGHWGGGHWGGDHFYFGLGLGACCYAPYYWGGYPYYYDPYWYPYYYRTAPAYVPPVAPTIYYDSYYDAGISEPVREALTAPVGTSVDGVTTTRDGWAGDRYCREFRQEITVDGRRQQAYGTACRAPNGDWQIVPNQP